MPTRQMASFNYISVYVYNILIRVVQTISLADIPRPWSPKVENSSPVEANVCRGVFIYLKIDFYVKRKDLNICLSWDMLNNSGQICIAYSFFYQGPQTK